MSIAAYIEQIKAQFDNGKWLVELHSDEPEKFRKRLYEAARRRGLLWTFAICDDSLFVKR